MSVKSEVDSAGGLGVGVDVIYYPATVYFSHFRMLVIDCSFSLDRI